MTHDERVWELYRGFTIALFPKLQAMTELSVTHIENCQVICYQEAEDAATAFEKLSRAEKEGLTKAAASCR